MQIVIPMSGFGERFRAAGYTVPKPLIEVEGKPIIAHVIDLFPGETDLLFICNEEHLRNPTFRMREILEEYCPTGRIAAIPPHKLGPVHAVLQVADIIDPAQPVVVNYCDFACYWNWSDFRRFVSQGDCDGAIPAYRGFHPHSLGKTNYAYIREKDGLVKDIREKQPFTSNRMDEFASSGTYYFASGRLMLDAFAETRRRDLSVNNEFYVSLAYKPLIEAGRRICVYELEHFMQWGTPEDLREYNYWSTAFRRLISPLYDRTSRSDGTTLVPMAGLGERFAREGFTITKPLIKVSGRPMVIQATNDLPATDKHVFVMRRDMPGFEETGNILRSEFPDVRNVVLDGPTDGQARTALLGWNSAGAADDRSPLTIAACDSGALFSAAGLSALLADERTDVVVWVARGYPNASRNPQMYGWVRCDGDLVTAVSIKAPLSDPANDAIITGTFTFRRGADFARAAERLIARGGRVKGEFYIDSCLEDAIALGMTVRAFEIDSYLCWGTPNDLRTFEYWQSCFHKWEAHPYRLELDHRVAADALGELERRAAGGG